jgi:hypothetical protein
MAPGVFSLSTASVHLHFTLPSPGFQCRASDTWQVEDEAVAAAGGPAPGFKLEPRAIELAVRLAYMPLDHPLAQQAQQGEPLHQVDLDPDPEPEGAVFRSDREGSDNEECQLLGFKVLWGVAA